MIIHNIRIQDFKSIYGSTTFNFDNLNGLIKLSGPIGAGKTTLAEAILYGLFGTIKGQKNTDLISWNAKACEVELNMTSKNKNIHIVRNIYKPLIVEIDGKILNGSSKRDTQQILEEEIYDVPKLAITKMCVISFNAFANSLANMNPGETKMFLDDIFGFKLFSDYNNEIVIERKNEQNEQIKLQSIYDETLKQVENLKSKQIERTNDLQQSADVDKLESDRKSFIEKGVKLKSEKESIKREQDNKRKEILEKENECQSKMTEAATLGKQAKKSYNTFKTGFCPTCGQSISQANIDAYKDKMNEYASIYREWEAKKKEHEGEMSSVMKTYNDKIEKLNSDMDSLRKDISKIDASLKSYKDSVQLLQENYEELIQEHEAKAREIQEKLTQCDKEIGEWNEMNDLFSKTLRYKLLETLIPHINKSIQFFINKLDQSYKVQYDEEFKAHVFVDGWDKEISYNNLSTGQKKSLDVAIIFGILQNVISSVNFNIFILDELFSNMDSDSRNTMLSLLNDTMPKTNSVFVINHAEMADDYFAHKLRVHLENKKIMSISKEEKIVKASKYEMIF